MSAASPLAGVRVVELASWVMAPAAAGILATFGAEVIKLEPPGSADAARAARVEVDGLSVEPGFELANNRKRSVQLDIASAAGRQILERLLDRADIFITNLRAASLGRAALEADATCRQHPRLIFAHATGYGRLGPHRDRAAFDELAYWARGGMSDMLRTDESQPVQLFGAMGDLPSAVALVAGTLLALYRREQTGRGGVVDTSLYGAGLWTNGWAVQQALLGSSPRRQRSRLYRQNPLYTVYRCADDRWVQFAMYQTDRYWERVADALSRPDLLTDERFLTHALRCANSIEAVEELQRAIGEKPLTDWEPVFDRADLAWSPILDVSEIVHDDQARLNGYIVPKRHRSGRTIETLAPPFQLRDTAPVLGPAPEAGQHTEEVLLELGYGWEEITHLRAEGVLSHAG